jgi:hypothetical protein
MSKFVDDLVQSLRASGSHKELDAIKSSSRRRPCHCPRAALLRSSSSWPTINSRHCLEMPTLRTPTEPSSARYVKVTMRAILPVKRKRSCPTPVTTKLLNITKWPQRLTAWPMNIIQRAITKLPSIIAPKPMINLCQRKLLQRTLIQTV